jgi:O-antigen ligase
MNSKERLLSRKDTWISLFLFALMFFSMYFPYNHTLAIGYQVLVLAIGLVICRDNSWGIAIIVILNATREYIAVSTTDKFTMYYSLNGIILLLFIIILTAIKLYEKNWLLEVQSTSVILLLFGLQLLLSQVWVSNKEEYTSYFPVVCALYIIGYLALGDKSAKKTGLLTFIFSGFFMAIGIIPFYLGSGSLTELTILIDGNGLLVDRNYQSLFLVICILSAVIFLMEYGKVCGIWLWIFSIGVMIADFFIIVVGASRSALLTLVVAVLVYIITNAKAIGRNTRIILLLAIIAMLAYNMGLLDSILARFAKGDVFSGNGRFDLWAMYINEYEKGSLIQKLFGRGLIGKSIISQPAHNLFVSVFFSFGIVGLITFLCYCVAVILQCLRNDKNILIVFVPLMFICCTLEPYYRIEFATFISILPAMLMNTERGESNE